MVLHGFNTFFTVWLDKLSSAFSVNPGVTVPASSSGDVEN